MDVGCAARVFAGIQIGGSVELESIIFGLKRAGYEVADLTHDEVAKGHIRHMVGSRFGPIADERFFRFDFPERIGALSEFLDGLGAWNISLFHYRNHGADRGRALVGLQVPPGASAAFDEFLSQVAYDVTEETDNEALRFFLQTEITHHVPTRPPPPIPNHF